MTDSGLDLRGTLGGALVAGSVSVIVLSVLTVLNVGSSTLRIVLAIGLGVVAAQIYERSGLTDR